MRSHVQDVIDSKIFSATMLTIIFVNTFLIALQTDLTAQKKLGTVELTNADILLCTSPNCVW